MEFRGSGLTRGEETIDRRVKMSEGAVKKGGQTPRLPPSTPSRRSLHHLVPLPVARLQRIKALSRLKSGSACPKYQLNQKKINRTKFTYWCRREITRLASGELKPAVGARRLLPPCLLTSKPATQTQKRKARPALSLYVLMRQVLFTHIPLEKKQNISLYTPKK